MPLAVRELTRHSARQPVPDNQEAFLSPSGSLDTKLIFEIAEYIAPPDQMHPVDDSHLQAINLAALKYYVEDLASVTDDEWKSVNEPRKVDLGVPSMKSYSAYYLEAQIFARTGTKADSHDDLLRAPSQPHSWLHLLFVRILEHESEFVVQMTVENGAQDLSTAEQVMFKIIETLDFKSFDALVG